MPESPGLPGPLEATRALDGSSGVFAAVRAPSTSINDRDVILLLGLLKGLLDANERDVRRMRKVVDRINGFEEAMKACSHDELRGRTDLFRERLAQGETLDDLLPEAFAAVREAARRTLKLRHYDVQMIGGIVLHQGRISEMKTGEGKTLVATSPVYLNALSGKGVHVVTVNDYLAKRDARWMAPIYHLLGLSVGIINHDSAYLYDPTIEIEDESLNRLRPVHRSEAYRADITYGTNNEFGFDYLRDNMAFRLDDRVQRGHHYAIVDEVDSVLIDEARTPLIISGPVSGTSDTFKQYRSLVDDLVRVQVKEVNHLLADATRLLEEGEKETEDRISREKFHEAGTKLLQCSRGMPKNKRLLKILNEVGNKKLMLGIEAEVMREKKMAELDEALFFSMDEKGNQVQLSDKGLDRLSPNDPNMFVIPDLSTEIDNVQNDQKLSPQQKQERIQRIERDYLDKSDRIHTIHQLLKAYVLFEKDVDYVVQEDKVMIVDEFTGRLMPGRRYSDGLHQALEAKEGVKIEGETQTLATITLQNYFRLYDKLAGMTGTAKTEANEFWQIYKLDVLVIPTNKPVVRDDSDDVIYRTRREKYNAIIDKIAELNEIGRPMLVGTVSVEISETLSRMLKRRGITHHVLNAKYHQQEAEIVARAGQKNAVTIATNMAGRGTDIKLGPGVRELGGLAIIGTERHEARRIDLQLRGRSGRQGDPGSSEFFLSLEDDLMRLFGSERISGIMDRLGLQEGEVITHPLVSRSIERAQKKVEANNFQIRKHLLEYDDVMNQQREVIYDLRLFALEGRDLDNEFKTFIEEAATIKVDQHVIPGSPPDDWDLKGLSEDLLRTFLLSLRLDAKQLEELNADDIKDQVLSLVDQLYKLKVEELGPERKQFLMQHILLRVLDENWREHLYFLDYLKTGINFRAYGQKDPLIEYKKEAFQAFVEMMERIKLEVASLFFKAQFIDDSEMQRPRRPEMTAVHHASMSAFAGAQPTLDGPADQPRRAQTVKREQPKVGRNDPCPCGSGRKFKHCCGKDAV